MKTAMKKIFSLMLVAVLLISAVPFAASATEPYKLIISVDDTTLVETTGTSTTYYECLAVLAANGYNTTDYLVVLDSCTYTANGGEHQEAEATFKNASPYYLKGHTTVKFHVQQNGTTPPPAPSEPTTPPEVPTTANLKIYVNNVEKYSTTGTPNSPVSVADCLAVAGVNTSTVNVTNIVTSEGVAPVDGAFTLGAAGSTTSILITTEAIPVAPTTYTVKYSLNYNSHQPIAAATVVEGTTMGAVIAQIPQPVREYFYFSGWYYDPTCTDANVVRDTDLVNPYRTTIYAKWTQVQKFETILKIYTNGNTSSVFKIVDIFEYGKDGKVTLDEVKAVVAKHVKPNTNAGLFLYGPFSGSEWDQYCLNNRYKNNEYVAIDHTTNNTVYVMAHNALIGGSTGSNSGSKADHTNPKTGDMIMMPAAVLGLSASALAVMFYLNKKKRVM